MEFFKERIKLPAWSDWLDYAIKRLRAINVEKTES